jgi:hypothetical protein
VTDENKSQGFWQTLPGLLTATATVITAVTGLIVAVYHLKPGLEGRDKPAPQARKTVSTPRRVADAAKAEPAAVGPGNASLSGAPGAEIPFAPANVAITTTDNAVVEVRGESFGVCTGQKALTLTYGQIVPFGRMRSFDVSASDTGIATRILLMDGKSIDGATTNCDLEGRNDAGRFSSTLDKIKRVEFQR